MRLLIGHPQTDVEERRVYHADLPDTPTRILRVEHYLLWEQLAWIVWERRRSAGYVFRGRDAIPVSNWITERLTRIRAELARRERSQGRVP
jgi:hypothetical protein